MARIINITSAFLSEDELTEVVDTINENQDVITFGKPISVEIIDLDSSKQYRLSNKKTGFKNWFKRVIK